MHKPLLALALLLLAGCTSSPSPADGEPVTQQLGPQVHVIVGVPDSGINPYHVLYYRENLTQHPSTYIENFPADIPALNLTVGPGPLTFEDRLEKDMPLWQAIAPGDVFWIPRTVFVAVVCESLYGSDGLCILDDTNMHGTGTTSSILTENPDALIAFKEGGSSIGPLLDAGIPVDVFSVSWGYVVPIPVQSEGLLSNVLSPIYVKAAGNDPRPIASDGWAGSPYVISVGGAQTSPSNSQQIMAANQPDVVSYYCRPTAQTASLDETREVYCGTSFATPTVAGALSKVILAIRQQTGYTGSIESGFVDPIAGITVEALREALNITASYTPQGQYNTQDETTIPLNPVAPWLQWGWGFYDGLVANATIEHLLGTPQPAKDPAAVQYMQTTYQAREIIHG